MSYTIADFNDILHFSFGLIYQGFKTLNDTQVISDGSIHISYLDILAGLLIVWILTDKLLELTEE